MNEFLITWENFGLLSIEKEFKQEWVVEFTSNNYPLVLAIAAGYLLVVFLGRMVMRDVVAFDLTKVLALWSFFLAVFSFCGLFRMLPFLLRSLMYDGYYYTMCTVPEKTWGDGSPGLWMALFMFSKVPELIDTLFIVLKKKPLIFLHWYHHFTVLLYCWFAYSLKTGSGIFFAPMNYAVHSMMYAYYGFAALKMVPKWFPTILITVGQIAQMVAGVVICVSGWYYYLNEIPCANDQRMLVAAGIMYASYLFLFVDFFMKRFLGKKPEKSVKKMD